MTNVFNDIDNILVDIFGGKYLEELCVDFTEQHIKERIKDINKTISCTNIDYKIKHLLEHFKYANNLEESITEDVSVETLIEYRDALSKAKIEISNILFCVQDKISQYINKVKEKNDKLDEAFKNMTKEELIAIIKKNKDI